MSLLANRFNRCSNDLSEDKLVNRRWSLLYCMLLCYMLPGTRGDAVSVWARASLDRFRISDLRVVAALRSASRNLLTLSLLEILVRPLSAAHWSVLSQAGCTGCAVLARPLPTLAVPKPPGYLFQNVHLHRKGGGVGASTFTVSYRLPGDIMLRQAATLWRWSCA